MSELKAYIAPTPDGRGLADYYIKSEADKVIAEMEMKLAAAQQVLRLNKPEALYSNLETMSRLTHEKYVVERRERRHKYKRCMAMAKWCMTEYIQSKCLDFTNTEQWYWRRWHIRWRELAKEFKEAK